MTPSLARPREDLLPSLRIRRGGALVGAGAEMLVDRPALLLPTGMAVVVDNATAQRKAVDEVRPRTSRTRAAQGGVTAAG